MSDKNLLDLFKRKKIKYAHLLTYIPSLKEPFEGSQNNLLFSVLEIIRKILKYEIKLAFVKYSFDSFMKMYELGL